MTKFNPGDPVLVRAWVRAPADYNPGFGRVTCAIVMTEFGNAIVEVEDRLIPGACEFPPGPAEVEARVEKLARVMAQADGVDPDQKATIFPPQQKGRGFVLDATVDAWRLYAGYARAIIDAGLA